MTIHPRPDQEIKIQEALRAGVIRSAEEVIDGGLEHLRERRLAMSETTQGTLVELFRRSPLFGLYLDVERNKDAGRDVDL